NREILEHFSWTAPRPVPSPEVLARLQQNSRPSVTDSEKTSSAAKAPPVLRIETPSVTKKESFLSGLKNTFLGRRSVNVDVPAMLDAVSRNHHSNGHQDGNGWGTTNEVRVHMERLLENFGHRLSRDEKILAFAEGRQVTVRYELNDVKLSFYTSFDQGAVHCGVGDPPERPQITLKMKADILDKLFTGRENGPKAAMSGKLSFLGDTIKAMSLQRIQKDLNRLYVEARGEVENLDAVFERAMREGAGQGQQTLGEALAGAVPSSAVPNADRILVGDIRDEVIRTVEEMYAHGLITSTGGNVSVRIPGKDEMWITPNSAFKGALRLDMLVRLDLEGNPIGDSPYAPSSERLLHCAVYRNSPNVGAVLDSHAPKTTTLVLAGLPFLPISTEAAFIGEIPRVPFIMPGTAELADAVGAAAKDARAVIMQNHGLIVSGPSLRHTIDMTLIIEQTADKLIACHALGKLTPVLPEDMVTMLKSLNEMVA